MTEEEQPMKEKLEQIMNQFVGEKNNPATRNSISKALSEAAGGLTKNRFKVICNETNNTPEVIKNNQIKCLFVESDGPKQKRLYFLLSNL